MKRLVQVRLVFVFGLCAPVCYALILADDDDAVMVQSKFGCQAQRGPIVNVRRLDGPQKASTVTL